MLNAPAILQRLTDHQVEFVVVGGLAMVTHGSATITEDLDLCYCRTRENIARLAAAVAPLNPYLRGAPPGLPFCFDAATIAAGLNFTLTTDLGPVDFLGEIAGIGSYAQVAAQSELHPVYDLPVRVLSLDALITSKKSAARVKDRLHLLELTELKKLRDAASQ
jgi:hypothetical protein